MRIIPSLLHLLLAVTLVLNGLGLSMPVHAADLPHSQVTIALPGTHQPAHGESSKQPPCHGEASASVDTAVAVFSGQAALDSAHSGQGLPDCCENGTCDGVCMQSAFAVLAGKAYLPGPLPVAAGAHTIPAGTATPALPHPIRPPIG